MTEIQCPRCGLVSRIPDGMPASCAGCGAALPAPAAFAQQMQAAPALNPVQQTVPAPEAVPAQPAGYTAEQLAQARKKRRDWRIMNVVMYAVQCVALALGVYLHDNDSEAFMLPMLGWIASLLGFSVLSAMMRPDVAYLEKPPFCRKKGLYFLVHLLLSLTTFLSAAVVYAIISMMFE